MIKQVRKCTCGGDRTGLHSVWCGEVKDLFSVWVYGKTEKELAQEEKETCKYEWPESK